jgi:hypothetical protein
VVRIPKDLKIKIKKAKQCVVRRYNKEKYLERNGINPKKDKDNKYKVILYKRVSKEYKTQEGTSNETKWEIGSIVEHPAWEPEKEECGAGKYHAVSVPYLADGFRNKAEDKYIAIEIEVKDLYEWKKEPQYPHKIAFRKGKVLYECDGAGKELLK